MLFLYNLGIRGYWLLIKLASLRSAKAKEWLRGRKNWKEELLRAVDPGKQTVWFHCASLGEFEQGRPVIEQYKKAHPDCQMVLTFFSPSGYTIRKEYEHADVVAYLPLDTSSNAKQFIDMVKPEKVVFVKYEYWYHFIHQLQQKNIPVYIISAIFRPDQVFFRRWGGWYRKLLSGLTHIFVQDEASRRLLEGIGIANVTISGDTRFDRVAEIASKAAELEQINTFVAQNTVLVAGSTWPADEQLLIDYINSDKSDVKYVIAPHEVDEKHIAVIEKQLERSSVRYTTIDDTTALHDKKVLIIDCIGILSSAYRYGHIAYIGGGFGVGIHNILEAATYGMPVIFGPNYSRFKEACDLVEAGGAFSVECYDELEQNITKMITSEDERKAVGAVCSGYVSANIGASHIIMKMI